MAARRFDQAGALYAQILNDDPTNLSAWMGMVGAHHQLGQDTHAVDDVQKMPPATYDAALADPAFLQMLGAIYQQTGQLEMAQRLLERAASQQHPPSVALQLQLAGIYPRATTPREPTTSTRIFCAYIPIAPTPGKA